MRRLPLCITVFLFAAAAVRGSESRQDPSPTICSSSGVTIAGAASGPLSGNTPVTLNVRGALRNARVWFGEYEAPIVSIDENCLTVLSPASRDASPADVTVVTDSWCGTASSAFSYIDEVCPPITFGGSSSLIYVKRGESATMWVQGQSTDPLTYQWYEGRAGDTAMPRGNGPTLVTPPIYADSTFWCRISSPCTSKDTWNFYVYMGAPGCFYPDLWMVQASTVFIAPGTDVTLEVGTHARSATFEWFQGSSGDVSHPVGTSSPKFTTPKLSASTKYWVRVSNACGSVDSPSFTVVVVEKPPCIPPAISDAFPIASTVSPGSSVVLKVTASGTGLRYQWFEGKTGDVSRPVLSSQTTYTTAPLYSDKQFWVQVRGDCGTANSPTYKITMKTACAAPAVVTRAVDAAYYGTTASLKIDVTGTGPFTYHWYEGQPGDTSKPQAATTDTFTTPPLYGQKTYWVRVTASCGTSANSAAMTIPMKSRRGVRP